MKAKYIVSMLFALLLQGVFLISHAANGSMQNESASEKQKDGEIIGIIITVDKNEIAAAKKSLKKATSPQVKEYANLLLKQHSENLKEAMSVSKKAQIKPKDSATSNTLKEDGKKELSNLSSLKGKEYDKAYIAAMVKGHAAVLALINNNLLKNVSNPSVKAFVLATRPAVKSHLEKGRKIQKTER